MNKARKKFIIYAECAIFVLLTHLLSVINVVNFTMVSEDADRITEIIASKKGTFEHDAPAEPNTNRQQFGKNKGTFEFMGPDSPELKASTRYFTFSFNEEGKAKKIAFNISAVTEEEAESWARSLINQSTGWTNVNYRYRVYEIKDKTYVTVIDQGRELLPSYRILLISIVGGAVLLGLSLIILIFVGKKLFKPLEESDRKQKQFIANAERDFKMPLTIINANTELLEKEHGQSEQTKIINKQIRKMTALVKDLSVLSISDDKNIPVAKINISDLINRLIDHNRPKFQDKNIELTTNIEDDILLGGNEEIIRKALIELIDNSLKYSVSKANFELKRSKDRIQIRQINDTTLPNGSADQVFDRFTILSNAEGANNAGLGLSYVKDAVSAHNGRCRAKVSDGNFILQIDL